MKVFISWSGDISLKIAQLFREWLPSVIQSIDPYVSSEDIDKGARWSTDIAKELENSSFGILCVTKDNIEAPWLAFEAGALSKTIEKSFVMPFLFDIKISEVQGPILQFQSTVFEKEDIRKMVKSLNKASGRSGIADDRLNKTFDIWYPTLENGLKAIKGHRETVNNKETEKKTVTAKILEEILELTRDNQKLIRTPNEKLFVKIEKIEHYIDEIIEKESLRDEQVHRRARYNSLFLDEILNVSDSTTGFLIALSLCRDDLPWIYDKGKELLELLKGRKGRAEKFKAVQEFEELVNFTFSNLIMRGLIETQQDNIVFRRQLPYILHRQLEMLSGKYVTEP